MVQQAVRFNVVASSENKNSTKKRFRIFFQFIATFLPFFAGNAFSVEKSFDFREKTTPWDYVVRQSGGMGGAGLAAVKRRLGTGKGSGCDVIQFF